MLDKETVKQYDDLFEDVRKELGKVVIGQEQVVDGVIRGLIANGHVLVEGIPGIAKTLIIKALAVISGCQFSRIQFTVDLLPTDIVGITTYDEKKGFYTAKGPIFSNFVIADEINRAPPKTQSALLEAMQERQATIGKETYPMMDPFFVMATQNPIESSGSLVINENVFMNGKLIKGKDLYKLVKKSGKLKSSNAYGDIYESKNSWTYALNDKNKLIKTRCMPYFVNYDGYVYEVKSRYGRTIKVSEDHPFLINRQGSNEWMRIKDVTKNDLLICPKQIPDNNLRFPEHLKVINQLKEKYLVVDNKELINVSKKTNNFNDLSTLKNDEFNKLRIVLGLSKKDLSIKLFGNNERNYWRLLRFFSGGNNECIRKKLINFFIKNKPEINYLKDKTFIESYKITTLNKFDVDEDIIFWLAFILSEGSITKNGVVVYQKNYPEVIERFIKVSEEKIGVKVSDVSERNGCRSVCIRSKALVDYVKARFFIKNKNIPYEYISLSSHLRKEFLKTFVSLESSVKEDDLHFVQKSKQSVDVISYLLLKNGFLHQIRQRKDGIFSLRIRDKEDIFNYLEKIGWIDNRKIDFKRDSFNYKKIIRINPSDIFDLVRLMGLNSFHTYKDRTDLLNRKWYCGYKSLKNGNINISKKIFDEMISDLDNEIKIRKNVDLNNTDLHKLAVLAGISIENVSESIGCSHNSVYSLYQKNNTIYKNNIETYIRNEFIRRLIKADKVFRNLKKLDSEDIIYDNILSIKRIRYKGKIFGLSVPIYHNYIGGFGACGINHNTYQLPQAQLDRFLFKVLIGYPNMNDEEIILNTNVSLRKFEEYKLKSIITPKEIIKLQRINQEVYVNKELEKYIVKVVDATRHPDKYKLKLGKYIEWGASPRASIGIFIASKADALMRGKNYVTPENIKNVAYDVLRHRVLLNYEGQAEKITTDDVVKEILYKVDVP
ncbi:MAG: AAA family ATPase [archaeon]